MMLQHLSHPDSSLHRFNCGNLKSLKKEGIRETLLAFHKTWYSANIMNLVVTGKHSMEQLEAWVREKFTAVPNKDIVVPDLGMPVHPFPEDRLGVISRFQPIKDTDILELVWVLPSYEKHYKTRPLDYFSHLFGHEGENSILSYLKQEDLAMALSSTGDHEMGCFSSFQVEITLTKKGLANLNHVIAAVFKYAQRIRDVGP
jgi:insulysin